METLQSIRLDRVHRLESRSDQYVLAAVIALVIPVIRAALNKFVLLPAGRVCFTEETSRSLGPKALEEQYKKWNEAGWKALYRVALVIVCFVASLHNNFFLDPHQFWEGCNAFPPCNFRNISPILRLAFAMELGFYIEAVPFLLFFEVRRKDYWGTVVHHIVTLGLIFYSSQLNFLKVGVAIIQCHEINDIFMEFAKMGRYAGSPTVPVAFFVVFALSWVATRLTYFPIYVIWNIYTEPPKLARQMHLYLTPHREIFLALLTTLLVLHLYWSVLIFKIVWQQLTQGKLEDIREEPATVEESAKDALRAKDE